jgi:hypothetical protein
MTFWNADYTFTADPIIFAINFLKKLETIEDYTSTVYFARLLSDHAPVIGLPGTTKIFSFVFLI